MSLENRLDFFDICKGEKAERTQRFKILKRECPIPVDKYCSRRYTIYELQSNGLTENKYFCLYNASYKKT